MNRETIDILRSLNNEFYLQNAVSFSATRQKGWPGWKLLANALPQGDSLDLLDVACGNMRFERYLREVMAATDLSFTCIDNCTDLAGGESPVECEYFDVDVIESLVCGKTGAVAFGLPDGRSFDAAVSFGFMHHVPSFELRAQLLSSLVDVVRPGGTVALSFWRFASDRSLEEKARKTTHQALSLFEGKGHRGLADMLEPGDFLVGWNAVPGVFRYCHSFAEDEISALIDSVSTRATLGNRYRADGRTGDLNEYVVLNKLR